MFFRDGTTERINSDTSAVVPHNTMVSNFDALALYQCKGERM